MEEKDREQVALFRYGLLAPVLLGQVPSQKEYLAQVASKKHQVPYYGEREFTPKTLANWLLAFRREGFEGLKPKRRSDRGKPRKLSREQEEHILALRNVEKGASCIRFYDRLIGKGEILPSDVSYATVYRLLKITAHRQRQGKEPRTKAVCLRYGKHTLAGRHVIWALPYR